MASAATEALERARENNKKLREELEEAAQKARKKGSEAKEAAELAQKSTSKLKRLSEAVSNREAPERAVAVTLAAGGISLLSAAGINAGTDALGRAVPFVHRNADYIKGAVPAVVGLGTYVAELATRDGDPLPTGREILSSTAAAYLLLGVQQLGRTWWQRRKETQRLLQQARGQ